MTLEEKKMFAERIRIEIHEYKHRETAYESRRRELLEIEAAYRELQVKQKIVLDGIVAEHNTADEEK